jgi:septum formation inhibitor-activating ATPase MinD
MITASGEQRAMATADSAVLVYVPPYYVSRRDSDRVIKAIYRQIGGLPMPAL